MSDEQKTTEQTIDPEDIVCGYFVGQMKDGTIVFEPQGDNDSVVALLGLHKYAETRLQYIQDTTQGYGMPVLLKHTQQISQMLQVLIQAISGAQKQQNIVTP